MRSHFHLADEGDIEIDVSAITMTERCNMEPWNSSTVCLFYKADPIVSKKVCCNSKTSSIVYRDAEGSAPSKEEG